MEIWLVESYGCYMLTLIMKYKNPVFALLMAVSVSIKKKYIVRGLRYLIQEAFVEHQYLVGAV